MYTSPRYITESISNNRLHFEERSEKKIFVPSLIEGTLDDVVTGTETVIEGEVGGKIIAGKGLRHFVFLRDSAVPTWICDNHNHVFTFWHDALARGFIQPGSLLVHIDQHTDLATPIELLEKSKKDKEGKSEDFFNKDSALFCSLALSSFTLDDIEEYANTVLTIADFIVPALATGLLSEALMVTGEDPKGAGVFTWQDNVLTKKKDKEGKSDDVFNKNSALFSSLALSSFPSIIVDIDLDYFSQGFDEAKTLETTKYWMQKADIITIATSPLFIDQKKAIQMLHKIFS